MLSGTGLSGSERDERVSNLLDTSRAFSAIYCASGIMILLY